MPGLKGGRDKPSTRSGKGVGMVLRQGGERAPHELRGRQPPCGEQAGKGQRQSSCDVRGDAGEVEQVWGQHQRGAVPGVMGSWPATLPPHRPSSPGTAAASEPSMSSTSGFPMATSGRGTKLSSWERSIFCRNTWRRAAGPIPRPELGLLLPLPSAQHMLPQHPWEGDVQGLRDSARS